MRLPKSLADSNLVVIGGGTGSFTILSVFKKYTKNISAIVNMVDDGGSTGILRDELGVLPPGDVRQCLVALSDSSKVRDLFNYRFSEGTFAGHSFGNILLTALEKTSGSFNKAVKTAGEILHINGKVIPATLDNVRLKMKWPEASFVLKGEREISEELFKYDPRKAVLSLTPKARANKEATRAIEKADVILIAPGDMYSSLGPLLVIDGIAKAIIENSKAKKIYIANLVTKKGQTSGFTVSDHAKEIERFVGAHFLDYVLYNGQVPGQKLARRYKAEDAFLVEIDKANLEKAHYQAVSGNFLGKIAKKNIADRFISSRSLIRHDAEEVVKSIQDILTTSSK